jgi:hypothetical protein
MIYCVWDIILVYSVLLIIQVYITCILPMREEKLLMANYKRRKQCDLLGNVKSRQKSQANDINK